MDHLSWMSLLMGVESNYGAADAGATVIRLGAEVAARLSPLLNCSPVLQNLNRRVLKPADRLVARSPPGRVILHVTAQS